MNKKQKLKEKKEYREYISIVDKSVLDIKKSGIELISNDEVFVLVNHTENYWISNNGRLVNNLRGNFYIHNTKKKRRDNTSAHFTLTAYADDRSIYKIETYLDKLVAEHFLEHPENKDRIWHIDCDINNNYYRNLVWVDDTEYRDLQRKVISVDGLGRQQEYVPYITAKSNNAYSIWNGIYNRCYKNTGGRCYDESLMCAQWRERKTGKNAFAEWYNAGYYECDGESMAVDKDLLFSGNKEYAPDKCCIIPQTINTMLSNCKKHRLPEYITGSMDLPVGVRYKPSIKKYYAEIKPFGHDEIIKLSYWDTPEEAFEEYRKFKQADILMMALKYKNKIPQYIYEALLKVKVLPYCDGDSRNEEYIDRPGLSA